MVKIDHVCLFRSPLGTKPEEYRLQGNKYGYRLTLRIRDSVYIGAVVLNLTTATIVLSLPFS